MSDIHSLPQLWYHRAMAIYDETLEKQRRYFRTGATLPISFRKSMLIKLRDELKLREKEIIEALHEDLGKSDFEAYATEIGIVYGEISYLLRHLSSFMRRKKVLSPITIFKATSYTIREPLGNVLIMSPWNYPLQLTMVPLAGAIAGGNTAIVKPSRYSKATSKLMKSIIDDIFPPEYIAAFEGGHETNSALLEGRYDMIFFTGSPGVGRIVAAKAAETLTPTVLELGGKSPVIIDKSADIKLTARRLAWGKFLNAGQTCVAPDYALADFPNVVNVYLYADLQSRIARIARRHDVTDAKAKDLIQKTDKSRASYYNYYTNKKWGEATGYDLCLNTASLGIDGTIHMIREFAAYKEREHERI